MREVLRNSERLRHMVEAMDNIARKDYTCIVGY
jgi:hypothetical protein